MSVEGINNSTNSNAGLYTAGSALIGGGAGALAGYYSRPFLKNGELTDTFVKNAFKALEKIPAEDKISGMIKAMTKDINNFDANIKTMEDFREFMFRNYARSIGDFGLFKNIISSIDKAGISGSQKDEFVEIVNNSNSLEEFKAGFYKLFDDKYKGKSIDEVRTAFKEHAFPKSCNVIKVSLGAFWDSTKKTFVNCEEGVGKQ